MTNLRGAHAGDVGDRRVVELTGIDDLDDVVSISAVIERKSVEVVLDVVVVDASARLVEINLGDDPGDWLPAGPAPGVWSGRIHVTFSTGGPLTWPNDGSGWFTIPVFR